nr:ulp1 protease family, C-terminal catalytic domain-containing protein [Tanacetum cinerariifolium]
METYKGKGNEEYCCGLSREGKEQIKELRDLYRKYAAKILLADCNQITSEFEIETKTFKSLPLKERQRLEVDAFKRIKTCVTQMMK